MFLCLHLRFLHGAFHGRGDGGELEWPPSPLRVFQALVATAGRAGGVEDAAPGALAWLERLPPPVIAVPRAAVVGTPYRMAVPNNDFNVLTSAWARGVEPRKSEGELRALKPVQRTHVPEGDVLEFTWTFDPAAPEASRRAETICALARRLVYVGRGVDLVVAEAHVVEDADLIEGTRDGALERWLPGSSTGGGAGLRTPTEGTLQDLVARHQAFLRRIDHAPGGAVVYTPPPPLRVFSRVRYRRATDAAGPAVARLRILRPGGEGLASFDAARRGLTVAGLLRHATRRAAESSGWPEVAVRRFVLGHGESREGVAHAPVGAPRFSYLPLPSIEPRPCGGEVVGAIRRVLVTAPAGTGVDEIAWAQRTLPGTELIDERTGDPVGVLAPLIEGDRVAGRYLDGASAWCTVTPVVLPGHDDPAHLRRRLARGEGTVARLAERLGARIEGLIRKAIRHAGYAEDLAAHAEIAWRPAGFIAGVDPPDKYGVPQYLRRFARIHVRIRWRDAGGAPVVVPGPVCVGSGRYYGIGLFARFDG